MIIRALDIILSMTGLILLLPLILLLIILGFFDTGSPIFLQVRIGKNQKYFTLIKLRTMYLGTKQRATHLSRVTDITRYGQFLRRTKLDELPQLINVLIGDMSLVGPRPGLSSQNELKRQRALRDIFRCRPGITGLAQINNIDMSTPRKLSRYDNLMLKNLNSLLYFKIILSTVRGKGSGDKIKMQ